MRKLFSFIAAMLVAVAANAATINIDPSTDNAIQGALNSAASGDEIVLAAGTYNESGNYLAFTGKELTVRAAEGAEVIIKTVCPVRLKEGAKAEFVNVKFDCSTIGSYEYVIVAADDTENKRVVLKGCEFYGWEKNKAMIEATSERRLASVTIDGCYFHNCMKSVVFIENTGSIDLSIKNSTFANISTNTESFWAGVIDSRATAGSVLVDHCTFYNVNAMNTDYAAIGKIKTPGAVVSNSIFVMPTATDGVRAIRDVAEAKNCITFNYSYDEGKGIHSDVTKTNCIQEDPKFVNAAEGNFTLGEGSPALTMNDGQPIGDPRWVPSVAPEVKYYLKNNWDAASDWTWKEMTKEDEDDYQLVGVVFGGTGVNVNTAESDEGADWYPIADIATYDASLEPTTLKAKDTVVFMYTPSEKILAAIVVGPYVEPEPQPVKTAIYDWAGKVGTTILGTNGVEVSTVKIHTNKDEIPAIKFGSSYVYADGKWLAIKPAEGGFKAGDVVSISGVISNTDDTGAKYAQIDMYAADGSTRLLRTENVVNGRVSANDPFVDVITLESDQDSLFFGRYGNTTMFITMLKVERAGGAPEPAHTYTVAGSSAIAFGTAWTPANTDNDMVKQEDGTYKWEKSNLELPAGTIEFKVCQDHAWATCWPAQNYALNVSEAATYTLTITFNPANENVGAELTKTGSAEIDPAASAKGSWDGWAAELVFVLADNKETASGILNLEPGDYEFKVILNDGDWRSNGYSYHREFTGAENITGNGDNMVLKADIAGDYTLTWTFATNALNITFPVPSGIDNTNVAVKAQKVIVNGQLFIIRDGQMFNAQGQLQ